MVVTDMVPAVITFDGLYHRLQISFVRFANVQLVGLAALHGNQGRGEHGQRTRPQPGRV